MFVDYSKRYRLTGHGELQFIELNLYIVYNLERTEKNVNENCKDFYSLLNDVQKSY